jgi:hypothetical protein
MLRNREELPPDIQELVNTIIESALALAAKAAPRQLETAIRIRLGAL